MNEHIHEKGIDVDGRICHCYEELCNREVQPPPTEPPVTTQSSPRTDSSATTQSTPHTKPPVTTQNSLSTTLQPQEIMILSMVIGEILVCILDIM